MTYTNLERIAEEAREKVAKFRYQDIVGVEPDKVDLHSPVNYFVSLLFQERAGQTKFNTRKIRLRISEIVRDYRRLKERFENDKRELKALERLLRVQD